MWIVLVDDVKMGFTHDEKDLQQVIGHALDGRVNTLQIMNDDGIRFFDFQRFNSTGFNPNGGV